LARRAAARSRPAADLRVPGARNDRGGGDLDEPLRIRREEELPVYERLGGRDLVTGRGNLAITLLTRNTPGDREEARGLLCLALADARQMQLPEAAQIEAILKQTGLSCD
jgi:hypothetical protein